MVFATKIDKIFSAYSNAHFSSVVFLVKLMANPGSKQAQAAHIFIV